MLKLRKVRLAEVADLTVGFVGTMAKHYVDEGIPFIRSMNVEPFRINYNDLKYIASEFNDKLSKSKLHQGDVVIVRTGKPGACAVIPDDYEEINCSDLVIVRPHKDELDSLYAACYINYSYRTVNSQLVGAGQQHFNVKVAEKLEINLPSLSEQKKIAGIIGDLNEKIRVNETINKNLLQQALCIYASLIDGKPQNGYIGDYCTLKSGFAFKSKWWLDSGVPVVKIGSINQDYLNLSDCSYVSEDKVSLAKDFIVSGGDLLIAMTGATIGKFTMVPKTTETILVNQRVGKFFLGENPVSRIPFIYCTLKQPEVISEVINRGQGSAQPNISASDIMSIPCVIPQSAEISAFNEQTAPMFELIINNQFENTTLTNTRDLLLPFLMSGELDVSQLNI